MAVNSTTEEYEGVELKVMLLFLMELIEQATAAKVSYGQLVAALEIDVPLHIPEQDDGEISAEYHGEINRYLLDSRLKMARIFLAVQGVLTSAALISKLLWMSQPQRREGCTCPPEEADDARFAQAKRRCKALRKALGIANEMPELNRRVRNSLEHYDDRMDRWLAADDATIYATGVGPPDSVGDGTQGFMRGFDPPTMTASVRGDSISLPELMGAVEDLSSRAKQWLQANTAYTPPPDI
jgi:hypothetical protein